MKDAVTQIQALSLNYNMSNTINGAGVERCGKGSDRENVSMVSVM